jgi:histone-lysine N-methyltransferase SETMAR
MDEKKALLHPPYSPDLAPSDYHLFSNNVKEKQMIIVDDIQQHLDNFFRFKDKEFYK